MSQLKAFTKMQAAKTIAEMRQQPPLCCALHLKPFTHMCLAKDCPSKILCKTCADETHVIHRDFINDIQSLLSSILTSPRLLEDETMRMIKNFIDSKNVTFNELNGFLSDKENEILACFDDLKHEINDLLDIAYQNYCSQIRERHNIQFNETKKKIEKIEKLFKIQKVILDKTLPNFDSEEEMTDFVEQIYKYQNKINLLCPILQQKYNKFNGYINDKSNFYLEFDKIGYTKAYQKVTEYIKLQFDIKSSTGTGATNSDGSIKSNFSGMGSLISNNSEESKRDSNFQGHDGDICSLTVLTKDMIATAGHDHNIKLWDLKSGECTGELIGHKDIIWAVKTCYDGKYLMSSSSDKSVKLWKISENRCKKTFKAHTKPVYCIHFMAGLKLLASGSQDASIILWDMNEGKMWKSLLGHSKAVWNIKQLNDRQLISCGEDCTIKLWDIKAGSCLNTMMGHLDTIYGLSPYHNNELLVSCSDDKTIKIWDLKFGICIKTITAHEKGIRSLAMNKSENMIATGSFDHILKIWDLKTNTLLKINDKNDAIIRAIEFLDETNVIYCDKSVKIYKITKV